MKHLLIALLFLSATSIAQAQESVSPLPDMPAEPKTIEAAIIMEPNLDLFSAWAGLHVPRLTLAPAAGTQFNFSLSRVSWAASSREDDYELKYQGNQFLGSAATALSGGFFIGGHLAVADVTRSSKSRGEEGYATQTKGLSEPTITIGKRFGDLNTTVIATIDYSPEFGARAREYRPRGAKDLQNNLRGGSLTTPRLTFIRNTGSALFGAQLGYSWFGAYTVTNRSETGRVFTSNIEEFKMIRSSVFAETGATNKFGATFGYSKFDAFRVSSLAAEVYAALAVNREFTLVPSFTHARAGTEGDLNDQSFNVYYGSLSARTSF